MSSFTNPLMIVAAPVKRGGLARLLPPSLQRPRWEVCAGFTYFVGSLAEPTDRIRVPGGFVFDGASVPFPFRILVPMAHPNYIQAAALHDWMTERPRYSRSYADRVFLEALAVLGMPKLWRYSMYAAVRLGALRLAILGRH